MIRLADGTAGARQVLARGRVFDAVSGRGLSGLQVTLRYSHTGRSGMLHTTLAAHPDGWFALHLVPSAQLPDLPAAGPVTVTATITGTGRDPVELAQVVDGARFVRRELELDFGGGARAEVIIGPPIELSLAIAPRPVALHGIVVRNHDPAEPIGGVEVSADGEPPAVTDAGGRFVLATLPVAELVTLTLTEGAEQNTIPFRPDHNRPINTVVLSRPG